MRVVEGADGTPLSVGRKTRSIPSSIKRALLRRDTACRFPGCANRMFLEGHHIQHWADGGATKISNLAMLCSHHHRFLHEYGYRMALEGTAVTFYDPRGRQVRDATARFASPELGWPAIRAANQGLNTTAETHACGWDGTPVNYADAIDVLLRADQLS